MRIAESDVALLSARRYNEGGMAGYAMSESSSSLFSETLKNKSVRDTFDLSGESMSDALPGFTYGGRYGTRVASSAEPGLGLSAGEGMDGVRRSLLKQMMERFMNAGMGSAGNGAMRAGYAEGAGIAGTLSLSGREIITSSYYEEEYTAFGADGRAVTEDGRVIDFNISLEMSRAFMQYTSMRAPDIASALIDPLIINTGSATAQLTDQKFRFDLDADGEEEEISFAGKGSGFLALDLNEDGVINDGSELFGTVSGNGFEDLRAHDSDGNGWIDENDAIFAPLRIWTKDSSGADQLGTLADHNIGALYLGKADTLFDLKGAQNRQHGQILSSGVWLSEDGRAGTMQQLDLFV